MRLLDIDRKWLPLLLIAFGIGNGVGAQTPRPSTSEAALRGIRTMALELLADHIDTTGLYSQLVKRLSDAGVVIDKTASAYLLFSCTNHATGPTSGILTCDLGLYRDLYSAPSRDARLVWAAVWQRGPTVDITNTCCIPYAVATATQQLADGFTRAWMKANLAQ